MIGRCRVCQRPLDRRGYHCTRCHAAAQEAQMTARREALKDEGVPEGGDDARYRLRRLQLQLMLGRFG